MENKIITNKEGYKYFFDRNGNRVLVHRRVMEKKLGRNIKKDHEVHHINKNIADNRPCNLMEIKKEDHKELHLYERSE